MSMDNVKVLIEAEPCTGCMICARECPTDAITGKKKEVHVLDQEKCVQCLLCFEVCRFGAVFAEVNGDRLDVVGSKKKKDDLVACTLCGKPVGTKQRIAVMRATNPNIDQEVFKVCPDCRRLQYAERVAVEGRL
jgi:Fe-S-cluster-containing hydrogenase component 2